MSDTTMIELPVDDFIRSAASLYWISEQLRHLAVSDEDYEGAAFYRDASALFQAFNAAGIHSIDVELEQDHFAIAGALLFEAVRQRIGGVNVIECDEAYNTVLFIHGAACYLVMTVDDDLMRIIEPYLE